MSSSADKPLRHILALSGGKLLHKLATIDTMDASALYTQILPHFVAEMTARNRRRV